MKYAFLIPIYNTVSGRLLPQFLNLQEWCPQLDGKIYTIVGRTHADARNWLCTDGGGFSNPRNLINKVDYLVWIDADQDFNYTELNTLLSYLIKLKDKMNWQLPETVNTENIMIVINLIL